MAKSVALRLHAKRIRGTVLERFIAKVYKTRTCWLWTAAIIKDTGYGAFRIDHKTIGAHRIAYILFKGSIPPGKHVLHKCDNRVCVRPSHLILGSIVANVYDMIDKQRGFWQSKAPQLRALNLSGYGHPWRLQDLSPDIIARIA